MAGFYPDVPGHKMAIDRDGSLLTVYDSAGTLVKTFTLTEAAQVNGLATAAVSLATGTLSTNSKKCVIFPELRDVFGCFLATDNQRTHRVEVSTDTTNGLDGTWTTAVASITPPGYPRDGFRLNIQPMSSYAVRGVRFVQTSSSTPDSPRALHLYGSISGAADRLAFWHPTLDSEVVPSWLDWGDVPRSTSGLRTFRVKNLSATKTAATARVAMETLNDTTPSVVGQHTLSADGSTWLSQLALGDLAPGAVSGVLSVRRQTPADAAPSLWNMRLFAEATSWT